MEGVFLPMNEWQEFKSSIAEIKKIVKSLTPESDKILSKKEAAAFSRCSVRTIERKYPGQKKFKESELLKDINPKRK